MTTKDQERKAVEKIRKIVEELGENSYVGFAMEGVLELAEDNIREDTAYSMKKNAEIAWERAADQMAAAIIAGEDVHGFAEEYKKQKANRSRYRKVMEELDKRERRRAGRE